MKKIADLHIHSKYSRATSPQMNVEVLDLWARKKGIDILATGDFTHPAYLKELKENLVEDGSGLLTLERSTNQPVNQSTIEAVKNDQGEKVGRNDPCPCGSGKKFKKCCG